MANSADPDQMPQNVASDQGLYCWHKGISIKNKIETKKYNRHPLNWKWACPINKDGNVHKAYLGLIIKLINLGVTFLL